MEKNRQLFFLVIILALIVHVIIFFLVLGPEYLKKQKKPLTINKEILFERPAPPDEPVQDLPTMLPGKIEDTTPENEKQPDQDKSPATDAPETSTTVFKDEPKTDQDPKPSPKRARAPKPTFNFNQLNEYANALGSSAFKNQGVDRPATDADTAVLLYQEKVRKHFHSNWNNYANSTYYYNLSESIIYLHIIIDHNGRMVRNNSTHNSNNPAILKLLEKVLQYCEPFPIIPKHIKLTQFTFRLEITVAKGKFSSGYGYQ